MYARRALSDEWLAAVGLRPSWRSDSLAAWTALTKDRRPGSLSSPIQAKSGSLRYTEIMATQRLSTNTPRIHVFYRIHSRYIRIHQDTYRIGNYTKSYRKQHHSPHLGVDDEWSE